MSSPSPIPGPFTLAVARTQGVDALAQSAATLNATTLPRLNRMSEDATRAARQLGRAALDLHLRHAAGVAVPGELTVGQLLDEKYGRVFPVSDEELAARQGAALARSLRLEPSFESDGLPPARDIDPSRFAPAGPALWVERERRSLGLWAPELLNTGKVPLALGPLNLRMVQGRGLWLGWRCGPAGDPASVVGPGRRVQLLCRTQGSPQGMEEQWSWAVSLLRQGPLVWAHGVAGLFGYHALYFTALALAPAVEAMTGLALVAMRSRSSSGVPLPAMSKSLMPQKVEPSRARRVPKLPRWQSPWMRCTGSAAMGVPQLPSKP